MASDVASPSHDLVSGASVMDLETHEVYIVIHVNDEWAIVMPREGCDQPQQSRCVPRCMLRVEAAHG